MRKLMTAVAAAATSLFAFGAEGDFTHTGFEASPYVVDGVLNTQLDDAGYSSADVSNFAKVWEGYGAGTNASTVVKAYGDDKPVIDGKTAGNNYLYVETDEAPVTRYVQKGADAATIGSNGIYLDTLVKFTPMDAEDDASLATTEGDKIAIALVGNETAGTTNFVVRAGYVDGSPIIPTNYTMNAVAENFDYSAWHRLIVEAISNVSNASDANAPVGFVVYVDGTMLTYSTDVAAGDATYVGSFNGVVKENLYNSSKHALLPSLVDYTKIGFDGLTSVSFKGQGSVDDIEFTATRPTGLPKFGTIVTIAWDAGVETVKIGADEAFATVGLDYTATNITVASGVTSLAVTATPADGKEIGEWTASVGNFADGTWSDFESGATLTINSMTPLFKVGDKNYGDFKSALEAAVAAGTSESPATIQLLDNYSDGIVFTTGNIVLDLNGKTLTGGDNVDYTITNTGAALTIIDSSENQSGAVAVPTFEYFVGSVLVSGESASLTINAGTFAEPIIVDAGATLVLSGGKFEDTGYDPAIPESKFYLATEEANYVQEGYTATYADGYFTVSSGVTPEPTTYELTIPEVTGATATVTDADKQEISDLTAIAEGTVVTVTWAATEGYKITAGASEEITMDANKTATKPTVVAITYATLTITQVENCTIVVSNATAEVASGAKFDVDDETQLTVYRTPANGYKLSEGYAATETITMDDNVTVTAVVEKEPEYPSYIEDITDPAEKAAYEAKYSTWATTYSVADGAGNEEAFLLNCAPANVETAKANFKIPSITVDAQGNVTVGTIEGTFNGKLQLKGSTDLSTWTNLNAASKDYNFFKYELTY